MKILIKNIKSLIQTDEQGTEKVTMAMCATLFEWMKCIGKK